MLGDGLPGAPRNLNATTGNKEITLSWDPPADNGNAPATRYRIEWRVDGKDYDKNHWGTSRSASYTTNDQANLANGVKYFFRVKAGNGSGNGYGPYGPASGEVSATPTSGSAVDLGTPVLSDTKNLHHGMVQLDWEDIEDAGWYVVQHYDVKGGKWLDLPAEGVDIAFHGSSAVVSNLHGLSWLRVRAMSCDGASEWSQIEQWFGTKESDWEDVPVPEVAEGDETAPCPEDVATPDNSPATGAPTISGTAQVGEVLTADTSGVADTDGLSNVQYEYQWFADDIEIAGATGSTYTLADTDEGKAIEVEVTFTDDAGNEETLTSAATEAVAAAPAANNPATGAPTISGTAQVGETLTAYTSEIVDEDGLSNVQYEYQWLADDTAIQGATDATYTLAAADQGKAIKVEVTFTDDAGNAETLTSEATDAVKVATTTLNETASEPKAYITVVIAAGDDTVSWSDPDECTSDYNTYLKVTSGPGTGTKSRTHIGSVASGSTEATQTISYSWTVNSPRPTTVEVELYCGTFDASSSQNVLIASTYLATQFFGLREGTYSSEPLTALSISSGTLSPAFDRGIDGYTAEVRNDIEVITLDPTVLTGYQTDFVRNPGWGVVAACGRGCNYSYGNGTTTGIVLADADEETQGFQISLNRGENRLGIGVNKGNNVAAGPGQLYYLTVTVENSPATGQPTISGTAQVGQTLTADTSGIADADGLTNATFTYQWLASRDNEIGGATGSTYMLVAADEGKTVKVRVSFTDNAGNEETLTSAATEAVAAAPAANNPATGAPTISGTAVGETLTAYTSEIVDEDELSNVQYEYQWLADDTAIQGATDATYTLAAADQGKAIKVEVTFTDDAGNGEALTSAATDAAAAEPSEPPSKPRGLEATSTHDSVTLAWDDPQDDSITGYVILRRVRVNDQGGDFSVLVANMGSAATTYTDDEVAASTTYTYRIKAINEHGISERSRWVHIDTPAPPVPDQPTGLTATAAHDAITLTWEDPDDDSITGYVILRRNRETDAKGHFDELVANTGTAATTYTDDTVAAETPYTYRIKAINEHGPSERSRWYHIDTPAAP